MTMKPESVSFFGIHASNGGRIMLFAGGIPLRRDGQVVGAVGVSGGSGAQDQTVAESTAAAFEGSDYQPEGEPNGQRSAARTPAGEAR